MSSRIMHQPFLAAASAACLGMVGCESLGEKVSVLSGQRRSPARPKPDLRRPDLRIIGLRAMSMLGRVFSTLQAALGVTFLFRGLVSVFGLPWRPTPL